MLDPIDHAAAVLQDFAIGRESAAAAVSAVARLIGAESAVLSTMSGTADGVSPFACFRTPAEAMQDYINNFAARDVHTQAVVRKFGSLLAVPVITDDEVITHNDYLRSELFNEFYKPINVYRTAALSSGDLSRYQVGALRMTFARGKNGAAFDQRTKSLLRQLAPHFNAASIYFVDRTIRAQASVAAAFQDAADAMAILDSASTLRYSNTAFEILQRELDKGHRGRWETPLEYRGLAPVRQLFRAMSMRRGRHLTAAGQCELALQRGATLRRYVASVSVVLTTSGISIRPGERLFLLVLRESRAILEDRLSVLRERYALTPAQLRVLGAVAEGQDPSQIADIFGVSIHTVRLHIKAILAKTGSHRQADLVRLVETTATGRVRIQT